MRVVQFSDIHIRASGALYMNVVDSNAMFRSAIEDIRRMSLQPSLVVISGDLTADGTLQENEALRAILEVLDVPVYLMPGNHDTVEGIRKTFSSHAYLPKTGPLNFCVDDYPLRLVALDSTVPGHHHGELDDNRLQWIRKTLDRDRMKPTLIFLHHPPFVSGIPYLDKYRLINAHKLEEIVASYGNIEAVLCGHVHRTMARRWANTVAISCPSTATEIALQLNPDSMPLSIVGPSACLIHSWTKDNGLVSHVCNLGSFAGPYPFF